MTIGAALLEPDGPVVAFTGDGGLLMCLGELGTATHALYVAYAPVGVPAEAVESQLRGIAEHVRLCAPGATIEQERLIDAWEEYA